MNTCPKCSRELSPETAGGLCPACLLEQGLASEVGVTVDMSAEAPSPAKVQELLPLERLVVLLPQFDQFELLGRGGMGVVYKARQKNLDRPVALKILSPDVANSPGFAERFAREARAMARLSHPNIVAVHDFGCVDNSGSELCYFTMEFVDGSNLRGLLKQLTAAQALAIVPQICEALQYAHDIGIVHRDIKPENILVDKKGRVKIADFGLAKLLQQARTPTDYTLTKPDLVMGTPSYMAPEQFEHPTEVDHRADLYSLGVVFYEMLTGQLPKGRFPLPSQKVQIDVRLDEVVLKALEHDRELRYQHASEVQTSVESVRSTPAPQTAGPAPLAQAVPVLPVTEQPPAKEVQPAGPPAPPAKLSRMAIIASLLLMIGLFALCVDGVMAFATVSVGPDRLGNPSSEQNWIVLASVLIVPLLAGMVATLLGTIAIVRIRRQPEKMYGLRLALFDALCLPLLLLDLACGASGAFLFVSLSQQPDAAGQSTFPGVLVAVLVGLVLDPLIFYWLWNKLRVRTKAEPDRADDSPRLSRTAIVGAICGVMTFLAGMVSAVAISNIRPQYYFDGHTGLFHQGPSWAIALGIIGMVLAGLCALAMPLLGAISVALIRRSQGKLYGLRLAPRCAAVSAPAAGRHGGDGGVLHHLDDRRIAFPASAWSGLYKPIDHFVFLDHRASRGRMDLSLAVAKAAG